MSNERRHPLTKERFGEGNRQKWVAILLGCGAAVLFIQVYAKIDPVPYLQFLTVVGGSGILGWSVDSAVKAYRVDSKTITETETSISESTETINENRRLITGSKDYER